MNSKWALAALLVVGSAGSVGERWTVLATMQEQLDALQRAGLKTRSEDEVERFCLTSTGLFTKRWAFDPDTKNCQGSDWGAVLTERWIYPDRAPGWAGSDPRSTLGNVTKDEILAALASTGAQDWLEAKIAQRATAIAARSKSRAPLPIDKVFDAASRSDAEPPGLLPQPPGTCTTKAADLKPLRGVALDMPLADFHQLLPPGSQDASRSKSLGPETLRSASGRQLQQSERFSGIYRVNAMFWEGKLHRFGYHYVAQDAPPLADFASKVANSLGIPQDAWEAVPRRSRLESSWGARHQLLRAEGVDEGPTSDQGSGCAVYAFCTDFFVRLEQCGDSGPDLLIGRTGVVPIIAHFREKEEMEKRSRFNP